MFEDIWIALCMLEKNDEKLLFISGKNTSLVYGFSSDTHEMIDLFRAPDEELITAMDAIILDNVNPIFLYGTNIKDTEGKILLRKNWTNSPQHITVDNPVTDLKFSPENDYVICCTANGTVYVIKQQDGSLVQTSKRSVTIEKEIPICINFCDQGAMVVLTTDMRKHYLMKIKNPEKLEELEEKDNFNMSVASLIYHNQLYFFPVIIGQEIEYIVSMRGEVVEFWKNIKDLDSGCGIKAYGHASDILKISVAHSKDMVYSVGKTDNCLVEWKVDYTLAPRASSKKDNQQAGMIASPTNPRERVKTNLDEIEDIFRINRELNFCLNQNERTLNHRDSMTLFRGNTVKLLNALHYKESEAIDERSSRKKRAPELSISLSHVYGIEAFSRRKTLFFLHYFSINEKTQVTDPTQTGPQAEVKELILPENYLKEMLFSKYTPIPYDQKHENCESYMVYFCSRIAIVSKCTTGDLRQKFYEGHRARISCMAVHPSSSVCVTQNSSSRQEKQSSMRRSMCGP